MSYPDPRQPVYVADEIQPNADLFDWVFGLEGEVFRDIKGRTTLRFQHNGRSYFLKRHSGQPFSEWLKPWLRGQRPEPGARPEWEAIAHLKSHGVETMTAVAWGERGRWPWQHESFLITEDLADTISLEDYCQRWASQPPSFREKRNVLRAVAKTARLMHQSGMNHRDFYLCHFLMPRTEDPAHREPRLHLIDLHRAQLRGNVPWRWRMKDLSGLYYSALEWDIGLTQRDCFRFMCDYSGKTLRRLMRRPRIWRSAEAKAARLYEKVFGHPARSRVVRS